MTKTEILNQIKTYLDDQKQDLGELITKEDKDNLEDIFFKILEFKFGENTDAFRVIVGCHRFEELPYFHPVPKISYNPTMKESLNALEIAEANLTVAQSHFSEYYKMFQKHASKNTFRKAENETEV